MHRHRRVSLVLPPLLALLPACSFISPSATSTAVLRTGSPMYQPLMTPDTFDEGVCIDPTLSTVTSFASSIQQLVSSTVSTWVTPATAPTSTSVPLPPQPGLNLMVRQVETNSFQSANTFVSIAVPAVPGLAPQPTVTSSNFVSEEPTWDHDKATQTADESAAAGDAVQGAASIQNMQLETWQNSDVAGCVSALATTTASGPRRFVLASDLEQDEPPQIAGNLHDTEILVIQPCDTTAAGCAALQSQWQALLSAQGASSITFVRPEDAAQALPAFMEEKPLS